MSQYFVEVDPLSICDYSTTYHNLSNIHQELTAGNCLDNSIANKLVPEANVLNQFSENHDINISNAQNDQSNKNRLDLLNDIAKTELTSLTSDNIEENKDIRFNNDMVKNLMTNLPSNQNSNQCDRNTSEYSSNQTIDTSNSVIKPLEKGRRKIKKERSTYWSEKITEKDFPFYGCAVCNLCYVDLTELDKHIATHKDRTTSYDLRVKNQLKRKKLKKERKKLKKLGKQVKKENGPLDIDIKPEDGYIGNEKASEFENNEDKKPLENGVTDINDFNANAAALSNDSDNKKDKEVKQSNNDQELMNLQKIFKCFACQKQFTLSYYLKLHVRSHTDEKPYTCPTCGQSFITASKLGRHNKRFHLQIKFQCRICYRFFTRFECLTTHFDRKHPDDKIEGEPYDYNAILPYLKELEDELKRKAQETKPKAEEIWNDGWANSYMDSNLGDLKIEPAPISDALGDDKMPIDQPKEESSSIDDETVLARPIEVIVEELKPIVDSNDMVEVEIKDEVEEGVDEDNFKEDSDHEADVKNESSGSDEEYFPDNTWVATKEESPPPPETDPLTCRVCHKKISSASYMKIHMRTHTGEKPFKCYICQSGFITSSKMHRHVLTHAMVHHDGTLEIKKEDEPTEKDLKVEKENGEEDEDGEAKDGCTEKKMKLGRKCKKGGVEKKTRKKHQKRPHACEFCNQRFLHLETLQVHKKCHEGQPVVYKCKYCLLEQEDEGSLRAHEASHTGPKPYLCTICGKGYKKKETMVYHRKHHRANSAFVCAVCSKSFSAKCKLQRHSLTHRRAQYSLRYECPVCAHMFHTKYHVGMHLATHQREGLIVEQNRNEILAMVLQNARKIPKKDSPANADSLLPADERSRVCNICGEVFQHFYYLEEHLKNHASKIAIEDEEKPEDKKHVCQVCNKSFKLHYYLKLHSFTHTKEKPYICQQCGKGFITRGKLKRHLETHAGLKKFQCHVCYKFFTRPSYLRTHVRTIHGTQDYNFRLAQNLGMTYPSQHA